MQRESALRRLDSVAQPELTHGAHARPPIVDEQPRLGVAVEVQQRADMLERGACGVDARVIVATRIMTSMSIHMSISVDIGRGSFGECDEVGGGTDVPRGVELFDVIPEVEDERRLLRSDT